MTQQPPSRTAGVSLGDLLVAVSACAIMAAGIVPLFRGVATTVSTVSPTVLERDVATIDQAVSGGPNRIAPGGPGPVDHDSTFVTASPATPTPNHRAGLETLQAPVISIPSGEYPITQFALPVYIYNSNPSGVSRVKYSVNEGGWRGYEGSAVMALPGSVIKVYAESIDPRWRNSKNAVERYAATPVELDAPIITTSAPRFDYGEHRIVEIVLENSNKPEASGTEYRASGTRWVSYGGPFQMHVDDNPIGAVIEARAVPRQIYYLESNVSYLNIDRPAPSLSRLGGFDGGTVKSRAEGAATLNGFHVFEDTRATGNNLRTIGARSVRRGMN